MHTGIMASKATSCKTTARNGFMVLMSEVGVSMGEVDLRMKFEGDLTSAHRLES